MAWHRRKAVKIARSLSTGGCQVGVPGPAPTLDIGEQLAGRATRRPFQLADGSVIDLDDVPDGMGVCYVCGIVPARPDGQGCGHPGHGLPAAT